MRASGSESFRATLIIRAFSAWRPPFAHFPFGGGPRLCIGSNFTMMEAQLILATIAQHYRLRLLPGHQVEPQVLLTMRPRHGLPMTLLER